MLGLVQLRGGDRAVSETYFRNAPELNERDGDNESVKRVLGVLAAVAEARGDADEAARLKEGLAKA
jgi:hypothetical protein